MRNAKDKKVVTESQSSSLKPLTKKSSPKGQDLIDSKSNKTNNLKLSLIQASPVVKDKF